VLPEDPELFGRQLGPPFLLGLLDLLCHGFRLAP
jgi:hypothetical protein